LVEAIPFNSQSRNTAPGKEKAEEFCHAFPLRRLIINKSFKKDSLGPKHPSSSPLLPLQIRGLFM